MSGPEALVSCAQLRRVTVLPVVRFQNEASFLRGFPDASGRRGCTPASSAMSTTSSQEYQGSRERSLPQYA